MIYIFFIGFLVSFDGFICGVSFGNQNYKKTLIYAVFSCVVSFVFSYIFAQFGAYLCNIIDFKLSTIISGAILIAISMYSILSLDKESEANNEIPTVLKLIACSTLAVDASFGAISLSLLGYSDILLIASIFGAMHFITVFMGILVNKLILFRRIIDKMSFFPALLMFLFGLSKIFL